MNGVELAAIEARAKAASRGPWAVWHDLDHQGFRTVGDAESYAKILANGITEEAEPTAHVYIDEDAEFIAHAREDVPALLAVLRERDNTIARVRALHVRNQDGEWQCHDADCDKCQLGYGHHGPICSYCSNSDPDDENAIIVWPCPTVQIIDGLPAPGLRAALDPQETP
ncbi:hypothetical protein CH249_25815 [Rhodococcus sp. 05-2255-3B1]|uniref:hypothetical protein n=1 Tax=Rhodococcus sp. 05-2255-3B1 TaxID=2022482 RepID=UPI000B9BB75A|nr:hypothetical protein [Rhodococcus sp. 05-2255-3B1]OZE04353.1 hypothetical protein CH249_25815 [Rhodococcus sp. 05-2255-3B1]